MKYSIFFSLLAFAAVAVPRAERLAKVDAEGVMRWTDDGSEVALFGVNYYPPFTVDYKSIKEKGLDFSQVMREDVAHFRRLAAALASPASASTASTDSSPRTRARSWRTTTWRSSTS